jgi:hypothetical protein
VVVESSAALGEELTSTGTLPGAGGAVGSCAARDICERPGSGDRGDAAVLSRKNPPGSEPMGDGRSARRGSNREPARSSVDKNIDGDQPDAAGDCDYLPFTHTSASGPHSAAAPVISKCPYLRFHPLDLLSRLTRPESAPCEVA